MLQLCRQLQGSCWCCQRSAVAAALQLAQAAAGLVTQAWCVGVSREVCGRAGPLYANMRALGQPVSQGPSVCARDRHSASGQHELLQACRVCVIRHRVYCVFVWGAGRHVCVMHEMSGTIDRASVVIHACYSSPIGSAQLMGCLGLYNMPGKTGGLGGV